MDGIISINKEMGYTSNDVIAILRGILRMKKIGHTGTLDPDATGVLPVCLGKATKAAELLKITSLSIADIGNAVGYPNQLHFSRAFKNVYGVSPRNWRNENKIE